MPNNGRITVTFWGAAHTVTGSMHLVDAGGKRVLLDCGLFQGKRAESYERNRNFPSLPTSSTRSSSATATSITSATCRTWCGAASTAQFTARRRRAI